MISSPYRYCVQFHLQHGLQFDSVKCNLTKLFFSKYLGILKLVSKFTQSETVFLQAVDIINLYMQTIRDDTNLYYFLQEVH